MYRPLCLLIRPRRLLPPDEFCRGTRPSQAKCRPELKAFGSGTIEASANAVTMATPEIVSNLFEMSF